MALVNPNIAMSFRQPEFTPRNALAEYAQLQQIQGGQQAQELARFQLESARRAESVQNALTDAYSSAIDPTGNIDYNKLVGSLAKGGGASQIPSVLKTKADITAAQLAQKKTQSEIDKIQFDLQDKKLKFAWNAVGASTTPEAAIAELTKGVKDGIFDMRSATEEIQRVRSLTPDQYRQYRIEKVMGILDAKDKLGFMLPNIARQEAGGQILSIQNNPALPGYGQPIAGAAITKTPTIGERTAQGQLSLAQQKFAFEKANPGFELQQDAEGNFFGINKRTLQAVPITVGGVAPAAPMAPAAPTTPAAPGAGIPGPRVAAPTAPAAQVIPGMTSVLDQPAAAPAAAPGSPLKGAPKSKDISVSEQQASYNIARVLNAAKEINDVTKKDPKALAPGGLEATLKSAGLEGAANLARSTNRQIVNGAQRDALDALLYLATGAAYNKEQLQGAFEAYIPSYTDDKDTRVAKQARMTSLIRDAKVRAGKAWTPKMDAAMQALTGETSAVASTPAPSGVDPSLWNVMTPEERRLWVK